MQISEMKYDNFTLHDDRGGRRTVARPGGISWFVASMLVAVPLPAFAEADPSENIAIALSSQIVGSQPGKGGASGVVPGTIVDFSLAVTGPTEGGAPAASFAITDKVPEHLSLFVGDLDQDGKGPAAFTDNDSGLELRFEGLENPMDSIEFSNDGGKSFDYVPVADADGFDENVTHIKLRPHGVLLAAVGRYERFSLRYRMKVK